jgi:hypothetical protein
MPAQTYDRVHFQKRIREELARSKRNAREFCLLFFEAHPGTHALPLTRRMSAALELIERTLRTSDVACEVFEDTIAALLVETGVPGTHDLMVRLGARLQVTAGPSDVSALYYPQHSEAIEGHPVLHAA